MSTNIILLSHLVAVHLVSILKGKCPPKGDGNAITNHCQSKCITNHCTKQRGFWKNWELESREAVEERALKIVYRVCLLLIIHEQLDLSCQATVESTLSGLGAELHRSALFFLTHTHTHTHTVFCILQAQVFTLCFSHKTDITGF